MGEAGLRSPLQGERAFPKPSILRIDTVPHPENPQKRETLIQIQLSPAPSCNTLKLIDIAKKKINTLPQKVSATGNIYTSLAQSFQTPTTKGGDQTHLKQWGGSWGPLTGFIHEGGGRYSFSQEKEEKETRNNLEKRSLHMALPSLVPGPSWGDEGREPEGHGLRQGEGRHLDRRAHRSGEALGRAQEAAHLKPAKTNTFLRIQGAFDGGLGHNLT